jgi:DNA modification methylase
VVEMSGLELRFGDCLSELKLLENDSVDLVCTDPPYGYSFMGKDWDRAVPSVEIWKECLRVLKPGCFAFVMSAPRSDVQCEMILRLKEAGFEVGFTPIYWAYASGFPKASNISKMVDKRLGVEPKIIGKGTSGKPETHSVMNMAYKEGSKSIMGGEYNITKPVSNEAKCLDGLFGGFQPKPAVEVVLVVMKPIEEKTFVEQALSNGHGGTWLGRCRIPYASEKDKIEGISERVSITKDTLFPIGGFDRSCRKDLGGRFPANLLVSDNVLDNGKITQSSSDKDRFKGLKILSPENGWNNNNLICNSDACGGDVGGFSRYFSLDAWWEKAVQELPEEQRKTFPFLIVPKASKSEKNKGCEELPEQQRCHMSKESRIAECVNPSKGMERFVSISRNNHPTVKPLKLMQYLVTLGCNKGEIVLDPFVGSGTTCIASKLQGRRSIGIEMNREYFEIAKARCKSFEEQVTIVEGCL